MDHAASSTGVTGFTISIWLKQSGNGFRVPLMEFQQPSALVGVSLWANTSGWGNDLPGAFCANLRPHDASASQPGSVRERNLLNTEAGTAQGGRWNHVVLAFDQAASKVRIHVNGKFQAFRNVEPFTPRTVGSLFFGIRSATSVEWDAGVGLVGTLDQADLFNRALGESEVLALYGRPPIWRYRIGGSDLEGLIAGELSLQTASSVIGITKVGTGMVGVRISYGYDPASGRLDVALAANRKGLAGPVDFLEVEAEHAPQSSQSGLSFKSAYLNEGQLAVTGVDSKPLSADPIPASRDKARSARLTLPGNGLVQLAIPEGVIRSVEISDIRGRRILARRFGTPVQTASFSSAGLPSGLLAFKVTGDRGAWNLALPHFHP